jgi:dephospho-CoA kinase
MLIVGLTGGIGSGKSLVSSVFRVLDVPIFDADEEARNLTDSDLGIKEDLLKWLGPGYYNGDKLDRAKVAGLVFNNAEELSRLSSIIHPRLRTLFSKWTLNHRDKPYVIHEAAILFESGFYRLMDANILVVCPEETRVQRVVQRDGTDENQVWSRLRNQFSDKQKIPLAGFIINNDGKEPVLPAVIDIHKQLLEKANGKV